MKKLFLLLSVASATGIFAQDPADSHCQVIANPYQDCKKGITYLNATPGFQTYQWSPAGAVSNPNIANPSTTIPGTYTVTACTTIGSELVTNGDFSAGNTGFGSSMTYSTWYNPGNYYVGPDWFSPAYNPTTYPDHTGTADNMFMSVDGGPAGSLLWSQTIPVAAFTDYKFMFHHTMCNVAPPIFEVHFTGDVTGSSVMLIQTGALGTGVWQWDSIMVDCWNSQDNNTVTIEVFNNEGAGYGNDFAMDDFSFRECCCSQFVVSVPVPAMGPNLFANWDFSGGNTGFFSAYNYTTWYNPGNYYVGPGWFSPTLDPTTPDHTGTSDNMYMAVDGAPSPIVVWQQTVPVTPFGTYRYSFWATRAGVAQPQWEIHFVGNVTGDVIVSTQNGIPWIGAWQWDEYMIPCWNAGQNTSVTIYMRDLTTQGYGDDYALDDFSFRQCCRPDDCCRQGPNPNREQAPAIGNGFNVFPNPSSGTFTIQYPTAVENAQVEIINVLGERVDAFTFSGMTYSYTPAAKLAPGVYLLRITNCGEQKDVELVIEE